MKQNKIGEGRKKMKGREEKYRKGRYEQKEERRKESRLGEGKDTECRNCRPGTVE